MSTTENKPKSQPTQSGVVQKISGKNTISVSVDTLVKHPIYGKRMKRTTKFSVHDPKEDAQVGDLVEIIPCRRISKNKSWRLLKVVRRGEAD